MITTGRDGLKEVAEKEGRWNWVLVGPSPDNLPLIGGGAGSIDELRDCLAKQETEQHAEKQYANFFGLLRLNFGEGRMGRTKYVFVQVSRYDEREAADADKGTVSPSQLKRGNTTGLSAVKHGLAMGNRPAMEKALLEFVHFAAKFEATCLEDVKVENVIEKVQKVSTADADLLTVESYRIGYEDFRKKHKGTVPQLPEAATNDKDMTEACAAEIFENEFAPTSEAVEGQCEQVEDDDEAAPFPVEKFHSVKTTFEGEKDTAETAADKEPAQPAAAIKPAEPELPKYKRGDLLFVYSNAAKQWMDDGIVVTVLQGPGEHDGLSLPKDSVKVQYNNRRQFKWVTPAQLPQYVRPSARPVPPPTLLGELLKETHNWISQWHVRYFELSKGYLQWWMSADDAKNGVVPNGSLSLTGLEMTVKDTVMYIRTSTSKGMIYAFDATTLESVTKWSEMLRHHEEYCRKMQAYLTQRANDANQGEKFGDLMAARKRRASLSQGAQQS